MINGTVAFILFEGTKSEMSEEVKDFDVRLLQQMGYKQELYRGFSPFMSFAFCFTDVNTLLSISIGFTYSLNTGGSGVTIWSWIIGSIFTILVGLSLAEICSVYPSAGSVYHWYIATCRLMIEVCLFSSRAGQLVSAKHTPFGIVHLWLVQYHWELCR